MQLPISASQEAPPDSLLVIITPEAITFENQRVVSFVKSGDDLGADGADYRFEPRDLDEGGLRIPALYDALLKARERAELLRAKSRARDESTGAPLKFEGTLAIQADKRIHYDTLRKIMYTAGAAGYQVFRFLAAKRDG
jgi:hypothetical protein